MLRHGGPGLLRGGGAFAELDLVRFTLAHVVPLQYLGPDGAVFRPQVDLCLVDGNDG